MPTREEVLLALANKQEFTKYIKGHPDFLKAAKYPEFTVPLFQVLAESTDLFRHFMRDFGDFYNTVVNEFSDVAPLLWGKIIQDINKGEGELFKQVIPNISQLAHILTEFPDVKSPLITSLLSKPDLDIYIIPGQKRLKEFLAKFPEFKDELETALFSEDASSGSFLRLFLRSLPALECLLESFPDYVDNIRLITVILSNGFLYNLDYRTVDDLVQLMTKTFPTLAEPIFSRLIKDEYVFRHFFYNSEENHLARFFEGLKLLPEQYRRRLWQAALLHITPTLLEKGIEEKNPSTIELLTNGLIKRAAEEGEITVDLARICRDLVKTETAKSMDNELLKQALDALEHLLSSLVTPDQTIDVRTIQRHTFLNGATHKVGDKLDKPSSTIPIPVP